MTTINYRTKEPVYYNKGTEYEKCCDTFLAYYTCKSIEEAKASVEKLNTTHPTHLFDGSPINWSEVDYFFVDEQEMFDTKDSFGVR